MQSYKNELKKMKDRLPKGRKNKAKFLQTLRLKTKIKHFQVLYSSHQGFYSEFLIIPGIGGGLSILIELREHHRHSKRANSLREVQVGDVVCVHEHKTPKQLWRMEKIERLLQGRDGQVRSAVVRVKSGNSSASQRRRPLQRLCIGNECWTGQPCTS